MKRLVHHIIGTRKSWITLTLAFLSIPLLYLFVAGDQFDLGFLVTLTLGAFGVGIMTSFIIVLKDFFLTERLFERLKLIDVRKIGDGNVQLINCYTGWNRKIEFDGTVEGRKLRIYHEFRKGWITMIPYMVITVEPDLTWETIEIEVDNRLTAEAISRGVKDAVQLG